MLFRSVATIPDFFEDTEINHNMNVYAVWRDVGSMTDPVTVWFDVNGGSGSFAPVTVERGTSLADAFPKKKPTKSGYRFKGWAKSASATAPDFDKDSIVSGDWTVYAVYEKLENVVPGDQEKPEGYVTITFDLDGKGTTDDPAKCYVKKDTEVTFEAPHVVANTGLRHTGWDKPLKGTFSVDTTIKATYEDVPDVVTPEDGDKPDGYSTVTFDLGENGGTADTDKLKYHVNPTAKDIKLMPPTVNPHTGYDFTGWAESGASWNSEVGKQYAEDTVINAQYKSKPDYVSTDEEKPEGYITVTFDLDGKATTTDKTSYFVNPEKVVELTAPKVNEKPGYKFKAWNKQTKAKFTEDTTITALYDKLADVVPGDQDKPNGYSTVVFDLDDKGTTDNTKRFYVNPDKEVELVLLRSEERRVGKECRSRWSPYH